MLDDDVTDPDPNSDGVAGWHSVAHITLIFSTRDLEGLSCIGDRIETVRRRA